jgi:hypothetical protein
MDNFRFDITGNGDIDLAMQVAFSHQSKACWWRTDTVEGYNKRRIPRLVLSWMSSESPGPEWHPFVTPVGWEEAATVVRGWLTTADYGPRPDHDGDNGKGWRVYNDAWGHVEPYHYKAFVAVEPRWAMYGK